MTPSVAAGFTPQVWLLQAERDLDTAKLLLREARWEWASYAAAQAAEKAVKAMLTAWGADFSPGERGRPWRVHDLETLFHAFRNLKTSAKLSLALSGLPSHDQNARYPDPKTGKAPCESYTEPQAQENIDHAACVVDFSKHLLPHIEKAFADLGAAAASSVPP